MDYYVEIPAGTALSAFDCIVTWNQIKESSAVSRARLSQGIPQLFNRGVVTGTRFLLPNVPAQVSVESLHQLVRLVLAERGIPQPTEVQEQPQPDGTVLLKVVFLP